MILFSKRHNSASRTNGLKRLHQDRTKTMRELNSQFSHKASLYLFHIQMIFNDISCNPYMTFIILLSLLSLM